MLQLCCVTSGKHGGLAELCSSERHSCAHSHASHIWLCVPSTFIIHVHPAFAATPCFTFIPANAPPRLTAFCTQSKNAVGYIAAEPCARNQRRRFRPGSKFCYALTSIAIHSQSVSQNLAQSLSSVPMNRPSIWKAGLSEVSSRSVKPFTLSDMVYSPGSDTGGAVTATVAGDPEDMLYATSKKEEYGSLH